MVKMEGLLDTPAPAGDDIPDVGKVNDVDRAEGKLVPELGHRDTMEVVCARKVGNQVQV